MTMHFPIGPHVAQEAPPLGNGQTAPQRLGLRTHRVEDSAPVDAAGRGRLDFATDHAGQRHHRSRQGVRFQERLVGADVAVRERHEAPPRYGGDPAAMSARMEIEDDVHHRQSRPHQHDVIILADARQPATPRIGKISVLAGVDRLGRHGKCRRKISDAQRHAVHRVPPAVRGLQLDRVGTGRQADDLGVDPDHRRCRMCGQTGRQGRAQVLAVQSAGHERTARSGARFLRASLQPLDEMVGTRIVRTHVADADVQQMLVVGCRIGDPAAEGRRTIELENAHRHRRLLDQVNGQHRAREASADDAEGRPVVVGHSSPRGFGERVHADFGMATLRQRVENKRIVSRFRWSSSP